MAHRDIKHSLQTEQALRQLLTTKRFGMPYKVLGHCCLYAWQVKIKVKMTKTSHHGTWSMSHQWNDVVHQRIEMLYPDWYISPCPYMPFYSWLFCCLQYYWSPTKQSAITTRCTNVLRCKIRRWDRCLSSTFRVVSTLTKARKWQQLTFAPALTMRLAIIIALFTMAVAQSTRTGGPGGPPLCFPLCSFICALDLWSLSERLMFPLQAQ